MPAPSDLVHETSASTGTGNVTVAAVNGKRTFNTAFGTGGTDLFDYYISNRDAAEWERGTGHLSDATTLVRDTVKASSNSNNAVNFSAGTKDVTNDIPAAHQAVLEAALPARVPHGYDMPINLGLSASVGANLLTVALKGANGSDPSATNKVLVPFRNATATTGTPSWLEITSALSIDTNATGATLGSANGIPFRIWVVLFNNGGTPVLGLFQAVTGGSLPTNIAPLEDGTVKSSTAISGSATSAATFYTPNGTAVTSKAYRIIGYLDYPTGLTTAGTYDAAPSKVQLFGPGTKKPGEIVQVSCVVKTDAFTSASTSFTDITGLSVSITPISSINKTLCLFSAFGMGSTGVNACVLRSMRGSTPIFVGDTAGSRTPGSAILQSGANSNSTMTAAWSGLDSPASESATTYKTQGLCNVAGTFHINRPEDNTDGAAYVRGTSAITVTEIMS